MPQNRFWRPWRMDSMELIALGHKARHGKDALAKILAEEYGYTIIRFSDALYRECSELLIDIYPDGDIQFNGFEIPYDPALVGKIMTWSKVSQESNGERWERRGKCATYYGMTDKDPVLLQWYGTDYVRKHIGDQHWISMVETTLAKLQFPKTVVPDVRFENEARWAKMRGALMVHVTRSVPLESTGRDDAHVSETALDGYTGWDVVVNNDGTLDDLKAKAAEVHAISQEKRR